MKQIPEFEEMELGPDGRLRREGIDLEMNPYCRRAVAKGVELARSSGGTCTVITLGPPSAEEVLREAIAWGASDGVLVTDPAFAGSDTLATARALAAALTREGPFDLVLCGRNSVDADTGQVGPELAELLDLPFATGVRHLAIDDRVAHVRAEHDDGWLQADVPLPAVLSTAERLCDPCKMDPDARAAVPAGRIRVLDAASLGDGPWGQAGSPTTVGATRLHSVDRARLQWPDAPLGEQVHRAIEVLRGRGALSGGRAEVPDGRGAVSTVPEPRAEGPLDVLVLVEPERRHLARELLGAAAVVGANRRARVAALVVDDLDLVDLGPWGADVILFANGLHVEEDVAATAAAWCESQAPWAVLSPSTAWGREVGSRLAARLGAGLTGDAVALEVVGDRLVAWKPAFGGQLVAAITASSPTQIVTVRAGMLPRLTPRPMPVPAPVTEIERHVRSRVHVLARARDDDLDVLADATAIVGIGQGVDPGEYESLQPLLEVLGAELGATRKVTDRGWLPRARQIGITGRSLAPRLFVSIGASGKFNHTVGLRGAGTVLAVNPDPQAPIFEVADAGIVGAWQEVLPLLVAELIAAGPSAPRR
ncbi:MAG: FAD-binding protein [Acidimicrobiia bacterium]